MSPRSKVNARYSRDSAIVIPPYQGYSAAVAAVTRVSAGSGRAVVDAVAVGVVGIRRVGSALGIEPDAVADPGTSAAERNADLAGALAAARAVRAGREVDVGGGVGAIGVAARRRVARLIVARVGGIVAVVV